MTLCIISSLHAHACASSPTPAHTPAPCSALQTRVSTRASPAVGGVAAGCQRAAPASARLEQPRACSAHPTPTAALLSSTTRRSWTCSTAPATLTHGTANPTSKSTRMPVGASTPRGSRHASSAHRMRWVQGGADTEQGWQLGATGHGCATWGQLGGRRSLPGWDGAVLGVFWKRSVCPLSCTGSVLTPQKGALRFPSLPGVVVADPVPKTRSSFPHHRQHPDERAELPVPCHLHHTPVPDESVCPPRAGEMWSCLMAWLFLGSIPR